MGYRNDQINEWGSYEDRKDSYDDAQDLKIFTEMVRTNGRLRSYIKQHTGLLCIGNLPSADILFFFGRKMTI